MNGLPPKKFRIVPGAALTLLTSLAVLFPLYWMVCTSLKKEGEIFRIPPSLIPADLTVENFGYALTRTQVPVFFANSVVYVIGTLIVSLLCASMAAYSISRFKFKGKAAYLGIILLTQLMPITTLIVPLYVSFGAMHLLNNRAALIIVYSAIQIPIDTWLLLGYFNTIPRELDEAARIDGCNNLTILFHIIIPLSKPGLMAVGLSSAISIWQELILAMTFNNRDAARPLMAGVSASITRAGIRWGQMTATGVIACVPIIVIYVFCQRYLVRGLTGGAVKG
ncbi:MAG: carbohydrate ABC transporter permease [Treponema sp.]|nr:carbohydrate ABC transporter permease [Treponema sp.]